MVKPGWFRESKRHSLAAKGVKTSQKAESQLPPHMVEKIYGPSKKFPNEKGNNIKITIYVPSTEKETEISKETFDKRVEETSKFLRDTFGGETSIRAKGSWNSKGKTYKDNIILVETNTDTKEWENQDEKVRTFLIQKKKEWKQESLTYEYQDESKNEKREGMHFI